MSINLETETIELDGMERIMRWEVWFQTPFGLYQELQKAKERCMVDDFDFNLCITPVAVAVSKNKYEVSMR